MAYDQFRKFMSPDFQASSQPAMDWMPWEQNQDQNNMGSIVDQLKQPQMPIGQKGGMAMGTAGKAGPLSGGGKGSL